MEKIILVGGGGHCAVVIDTIRQQNDYEIAGITELPGKDNQVDGIAVIGTDEVLKIYFDNGVKRCFITVGSTDDQIVRERLFSQVKKIGFILPNIISRRAVVSPSINIGEGNFVATGSIINSGVVIGSNCIINTRAIIEHNCVIGDSSHISTGAVLCGGVSVGSGTHIGANSTVKQNLRIGNKTVIGIGSVVVKDIGDGVIAFGNPCEVKRKNE
ncbi:MAG: acetyltransferase [bacterium]